MEIELLALVLKCRIPPMFIQQEQAEESSRHWAWTICACRWNGRLAVTRHLMSANSSAFLNNQFYEKTFDIHTSYTFKFCDKFLYDLMWK